MQLPSCIFSATSQLHKPVSVPVMINVNTFECDKQYSRKQLRNPSPKRSIERLEIGSFPICTFCSWYQTMHIARALSTPTYNTKACWTYHPSSIWLSESSHSCPSGYQNQTLTALIARPGLFSKDLKILQPSLQCDDSLRSKVCFRPEFRVHKSVSRSKKY